MHDAVQRQNGCEACVQICPMMFISFGADVHMCSKNQPPSTRTSVTLLLSDEDTKQSGTCAGASVRGVVATWPIRKCRSLGTVLSTGCEAEQCAASWRCTPQRERIRFFFEPPSVLLPPPGAGTPRHVGTECPSPVRTMRHIGLMSYPAASRPVRVQRPPATSLQAP